MKSRDFLAELKRCHAVAASIVIVIVSALSLAPAPATITSPTGIKGRAVLDPTAIEKALCR
jgi:hypothetical protein